MLGAGASILAVTGNKRFDGNIVITGGTKPFVQDLQLGGHCEGIGCLDDIWRRNDKRQRSRWKSGENVSCTACILREILAVQFGITAQLG